MKAFKRSSVLALIGAAAVLAGLANLPTRAAAATVIPAATCDEGFCRVAENLPANTDALDARVDSAVAIALSAQRSPETPARGSEISAAAMIALGVVLITSRVSRKGLWVFRAPWRTMAGQPG